MTRALEIHSRYRAAGRFFPRERRRFREGATNTLDTCAAPRYPRARAQVEPECRVCTSISAERVKLDDDLAINRAVWTASNATFTEARASAAGQHPAGNRQRLTDGRPPSLSSANDRRSFERRCRARLEEQLRAAMQTKASA